MQITIIPFSESKLAEYNNLKEQIDSILSSADGELTSQKGISKDPAVIKEQQEALKGFVTDRMDPLQKLMAALAKCGQELVGSAAAGVDTANLEKEMEEASDKWTELQQKVICLMKVKPKKNPRITYPMLQVNLQSCKGHRNQVVV